eukprot:COSAG02_NODE_929_length_15840_cov_55.918493_9_plen_86_part_00
MYTGIGIPYPIVLFIDTREYCTVEHAVTRGWCGVTTRRILSAVLRFPIILHAVFDLFRKGQFPFGNSYRYLKLLVPKGGTSTYIR